MIFNGFKIEVESFWNNEEWEILYRPGHYSKKIWNTLFAFYRRLSRIHTYKNYDYVFIHREVAPIGPPVIEWIISKVLKKKIVYDFDDAIWLPNTSKENKIVSWLKFHSKTSVICKLSHKVSCGNQFLVDYALRYNTKSIYNPSTIDFDYHTKILKENQHMGKLVIGWTGSHSTLKYLNLIVPILDRLEANFEFEFRVISNSDPRISLRSYKFIRWNKSSEISDLQDFDIGIMPLYDDIWAKGKCGFKLLQYMSLGIPSLASPVGVNTQIIDHGINGFLCSTEEMWEQNFITLLKDSFLRRKMGDEAQLKVEKYYSVKSNENNFLSLFTE